MKQTLQRIAASFILCITAFAGSSIGASDKDDGTPSNPVIVSDGVADKKDEWKPLFDGETLTDWSVPEYGGDGEVQVQDGNIVIGRGLMMTGIRYDKDFPNINYEIQYEARRTHGFDFFAACTFPVGDNFCTFINGGWGGGLTGLSNINGVDASENQTTMYFNYRSNVWHRFRIQVTDSHIRIWIAPFNREGNWDAEKLVIDVEKSEKKFSTRSEVDMYKPLGFTAWSTEGELREIKYRVLNPGEGREHPFVRE